jgi:hypothetical protein
MVTWIPGYYVHYFFLPAFLTPVFLDVRFPFGLGLSFAVPVFP